MIRLILFAACEKAIVGQDNTSSLITLLESLDLTVKSDEELPPNAAIPFKWVAFILWARTEDVSEPVEFEDRIDMVAPDGSKLMGGVAKFAVSNNHLNFRTVLEFPTFPIGQDGIYRLSLKSKRVGAEDWEQVGEYPIRVIHRAQDVKDGNEKVNEIVEQSSAE